MFGISYLSSQNQEQINKLRKQLENTTEADARVRLNDDIIRIEDSRKPLKECTAEECQDLKSQVYRHYTNLMRIGKRDQAMAFYQILSSIDTKITLLMQEERQKQVDSSDSKIDSVSDDLSPGPKLNKGNQKGSAKWDVDLSGF